METYEVINKRNGNETNNAKKKTKGKLEANNAMKTDLNALDSESSGRESDDEDSESVGLDDALSDMAPAAMISGGIGAGLGIGAAMSMSNDPTDVLGVDAREVEIIGSLAKAFNVSDGEDDEDDGSEGKDVDDDENEIYSSDDDYDDDDESPVETIGGGDATEEKPEGLRKRPTVDKTDSS
jgi:hypothetical protein